MKYVVHCKREPYDVLIDRTTEWGNPFKIGKDSGGTVWSREDVINLFESWIKYGGPDMIAKVKRELKGKVLGCWCAPKPCHGDVLARIANEE